MTSAKKLTAWCGRRVGDTVYPRHGGSRHVAHWGRRNGAHVYQCEGCQTFYGEREVRELAGEALPSKAAS